MKISIVTTAYNIESYIKECLDSIIAQTYNNLEIIVVNDCSTDSTADIIASYDDERIVIVNHETNMGAGWARRHGIDVATGEYVITIDGDDWISPSFIENLVENAKTTNADIVSGGITIVHSEEYYEIKKFTPMISIGTKKFKDYDDKKIVFLNNKLVRRALYDEVPYCTRRFCEDTPVIFQLLYYANMVSYVDEQGYFYRQYQNSLCRRTNEFEQALFKALCCKDLYYFFKNREEYTNILNLNETYMYLKKIKFNITPEYAEQYKLELGELMPLLLDLME